MAKDISAPHLWKLDAAEVVVAAGTKVFVRKVVFWPAVNTDDLILREYLGDNTTLKDAIIMKGNLANLQPVEIDFGREGIALNGLTVGTIDGGAAHVYISRARSRVS
jgi:hypothetical protein